MSTKEPEPQEFQSTFSSPIYSTTVYPDNLLSYDQLRADSSIRRCVVSSETLSSGTLGLGLTVTSDLDLQSHESHGHDPCTRKRSRSKVSRFERQSGNRRTDGQTDELTDGGDCITSGANVVGNELPERIKQRH